MKRIVLMDCDPGHDDAIALLLAFSSSLLDVRAVTVSAGNQTGAKTLNNAKRIISSAQRSLGKGFRVPRIAGGATKPLFRELIVAPSVHGESGLDGPDIPESDLVEESIGAVELLRQEITGAERKVTLVATGPLTNIAALFLAHPEVKQNIELLSIMGGSVVGGNWTAAAEFNILVDPEAASICFNSGVPIAMAGLDVTHKALVYPEDVEMLRAMGGYIPVLTAELLDFFMKFHLETGFKGAPVHDACAVAYLIAPEIFETAHFHIDIETEGAHTLGATVADQHNVTGKPKNATALMGVNRTAFLAMLQGAMQVYLHAEKGGARQ
ncbi:MAG: nucleoside hydrolase [Oscillospiraceae bacterium]